MPKSEFIFDKKVPLLPAGEFSSRAPSNIALIKYWGKYGLQLPKNPSLSFTLSQCSTETHLQYTPTSRKTKSIEFEVLLEKQKALHFRPKMETFFQRIVEFVPFIREYSFLIKTTNTFPHSSGIASSASGMAALAHTILQMEKALNPGITKDYFNKKASFLARLGSGSAARSILGPITIWGKDQNIPESSNQYAVPTDFPVHSIFRNYQDTILLVDKGEKKISSTLGHNLMNGHPFAAARFEQAHTHLKRLIEALGTGDLKQFITIVESEALTLHAMMMTSSPYFILMKPNTLKIIEEIWKYRENTGRSLCFTLDAGANVHLLYPEKEKERTLVFIRNQLTPYCENHHFICDRTGKGCVVL